MKWLNEIDVNSGKQSLMLRNHLWFIKSCIFFTNFLCYGYVHFSTFCDRFNLKMQIPNICKIDQIKMQLVLRKELNFVYFKVNFDVDMKFPMSLFFFFCVHFFKCLRLRVYIYIYTNYIICMESQTWTKFVDIKWILYIILYPITYNVD